MHLLVFAIILLKGKLLLVKNQYTKDVCRWTFPGGAVEKGETLEEAVRREVEEETGYIIKDLKIAYFHEVLKIDSHKRGIIFEAKIENLNLADDYIIEDPSHIVVSKKWIPLEEVKDFVDEKYYLPFQKWLKKLNSSEYFVTNEKINVVK